MVYDGLGLGLDAGLITSAVTFLATANAARMCNAPRALLMLIQLLVILLLRLSAPRYYSRCVLLPLCSFSKVGIFTP